MQAPRRAASLGFVATAIVAGSALMAGPAVAQTDLGPATGEVTILMIGWPDQDGIDPDGNPQVGIGYVEQLFEAAHPGDRPQDRQYPVGLRLDRLRSQDRVDDPGE